MGEQIEVGHILSGRLSRHQVMKIIAERLGKMILAEPRAGDHIGSVRHQYLVTRDKQVSSIGRIHTGGLLLTSGDMGSRTPTDSAVVRKSLERGT
ncbi:hypothetical protein D9M71_801940 [compost metagenome]